MVDLVEHERWLAIPGYEGIYEISDRGRVRRLVQRYFNCVRPLAAPVLVSPKRTGKYLGVDLAKDGVKTRCYIQRLVLITFVNDCGPQFDAAHLDGNRKHNWLSNLKWKSVAGNHADKHLHGTALVGEKNHRAKLTEAAVREIRSTPRRELTLARKFNVSRSLIGMVRRREIWTHVA